VATKDSGLGAAGIPAMVTCECTGANEVHCFRLTFRTPQGDVELNLHAWALAELVRACNAAYMQWMGEATESLVCKMTGLTPEEARAAGLLAPRPAPAAEGATVK
jgi:hypothetical protein